jgi:hypothetical protein
MALALSGALCLGVAGCGRSSGPQAIVLERVSVDGGDVARALGPEVYGFKADSPRQVNAQVVWPVGVHTRSPEGPVSETHQLGGWEGPYVVLDEVLVMLPNEASDWRHYFAMGDCSVSGTAPESVRMDVDSARSRSAP